MKRRSAIILFGSLLAALGAYVAWCLRPFYLAPELKYDAAVSPGGRAAVESWAKFTGLPGPVEFDRDEALSRLCDPWGASFDPALVEETPAEGLWVRHGSRIWKARVWTFSKAGGEWQSASARRQMVHTDGELAWIQRQEMFAARLEELMDSDGTLEILSLHPRSINVFGASERKLPDLKGMKQEIFHEYPVLGRLKVQQGEDRKALIAAFVRSVREAGDVDYLCFNPRHGIIHTRAGKRREFLICFECQRFESHEDGSEDFEWSSVGPSAKAAFDAFLDQHRVPRDTSGH